MWALSKISLAISLVVFSQSPPVPNEYIAVFQACDKGFTAPQVAIPACSRIINEKPPTAIIPNAYINRGHAWKGLNNFEEAIKDYTFAIEMDPINDRAFGERGLAWREKGDQTRALSDLARAIAINKDNPIWRFARATVYMNNSDDDLAISDLNEAIRLDQKFWNAYAVRATLYNNKRIYDKSVADLDMLIKFNPNNNSFLLQRARIYLDAGSYKPALDDINYAIKLDSSSLSARSMQADTYRRLKQKEQAKSSIKFVLSRDPNNCEALLVEARMLDEAARTGEAISALSRCLTATPTDLLGLIWRARFYLRERQFIRALVDANKANMLYPNTPAVLTIKGQAEGEEGHIDQARQSFRSALKVDSTYTAAGLEWARVEITDRNYRAAIGILADVITQKPTSNFEELAGVKAEAQKLLSTSQGAIQRNQASSERRVALIIGNDKYHNVPQLISASYDANDVAKILQRLGFNVIEAQDASRVDTLKAVEKFENASKTADWAFIYYAGHGIEINGESYIVPVDASFNADTDVAGEAVSINRLLKAASNAKKLRFIVLDACRNNPFLRHMKRQISSPASEGGLGRIEPDFGTLVFLAAKQGEVAYDAVKPGLHSPFSEAFIRRLKEEDLEIRRFVGLVTDDVLAATSNRQRPYTFGSLGGRQDYYFK